MAPGVLPTALSLALASAAALAPTRGETATRGPNLALHRPAQQSSRSQWSRPADPQGGVDGVKTGAYGFHTEYEPKPWWAVDLQQVAELDELRIYNSRRAPEAARTIQVWLSTDGVSWTRAYAHDGSLFGGADGPLQVRLAGRRARHVRVQLAHTDYLHLNEIEVYGRPVAAGPARRARGFGPEAEIARTRVSSESGGYVRLANGARFEVPRGVVAGEAEVRVHRAIPSGAATRAGLLSDVHYLDSDVRPKLDGHSSLRVPLGVGQAPEDGAAYAVSDTGLVYGIPARGDAATLTMVIEDPEIAVVPPARDAAHFAAARADTAPRMGYAVGPAAGVSPHPSCLGGAPGEIHDEPGHCFRVVFHVQAPCALAREVSDVLQQALEAYDTDFPDADGRRPFAHLSPENRMWVYLLDDGPIGSYEHSLRWQGAVRVNVALARADPAGLRDTLFHEMFHAVQDAHSSVSLAGGAAQWWYEATAEWAGMKYSRAVPRGAERSVDFPSAVRTQLSRHDYLLSVPIDESGDYEGGTLAYGYALLVDHVERQAPGYVRQSLLGGGGTSGRLYAGLVAEGRLRDTYPEFLASVMAEAPPAGPWLQASLEESDHETRVVTHPAGKLGEPKTVTRAVRDDVERAAPHVFGAVLRPLTARFFKVKAADQDLSGSRTVKIALLSEQPDVAPRVLVAAASRGQDRRVVLRPTAGTLGGLGGVLRELWIAVYNPDPTSAAEFRLSITLEQAPAPAAVTYALVDTRPSPDRARGASWSYGDEDAIEDAMYPDGRRELRRFALTTRPPQTIVPGVPFTIAVTAAARDEGGAGSSQHDVSPVFYAGDSRERLEARGWVKGDNPTVGTNVEKRAFTARAAGQWTVTLPGGMPDSFVLELRIRSGVGVEARDFGWLTFRYRRR
jgi:hypothetical protein